MTRLELATSSLARKCSTTELHPRGWGLEKSRTRPLIARGARRKHFFRLRAARARDTVAAIPMDRLAQILQHKRDEIAALRPRRDELRRLALERNDFRGFAAALRGGEGRSLALIAEVKKASPSAGVIALDFDPVAIARQYEAAGADAVLVFPIPAYLGQPLRPQVPYNYHAAIAEAISRAVEAAG